MLLDRFLKYVKFDTQADPNSNSVPSSKKQLDFLLMIKDELISYGLSEIEIYNNKTLFATINAANDCLNDDAIGLIAHVDTSYDAPSKNICPIVHKYSGGDIILPNGVISINDYPELKEIIGHKIVTSDGNTLLGADDKAGVAILMQLPIELNKQKIKHPKIRLAFTTDEEIGRSIDNFDVQKFGVKKAYTLDSGGGDLLEYENFNAASAIITIDGKNIHPGYAFDKMVNACDIANEFHSLIPTNQRPVNTQNREGFFHLNNIEGSVEKAKLHYLIRDFDEKSFLERKKILTKITDSLNRKYDNAVKIEINDSYLNMRNFIPDNVIEKARKAYLAVGITPDEKPIRGGTDGARLSQLGVPTPNLFNGGMNFHSKHEYCSVENMEKALEMTIRLVSLS